MAQASRGRRDQVAGEGREAHVAAVGAVPGTYDGRDETHLRSTCVCPCEPGH